jgi:hypothetical protein
MTSEEMTPSAVRLLAALAHAPILTEDLEPLAQALRDYLGSMAFLEQLDLTDSELAVWFDPRWE